MNKSFQRRGSISNSHVGREFEALIKKHYESLGLKLAFNIKIPIGIRTILKDHSFDLGNLEKKIIVECKSHKWTAGDNVPSAKLTNWNEAMYYFFAAPMDYRKIMFVLHDYSVRRNETLAEYYFRTYNHLIPSDVELWEYNGEKKFANRINIK